MKGELYIDGVDIYTAYGVSISDIAYKDLACLPELKPIAFNDWQEKNGIDPDLSSPIIKAKSITIPFHLSGSHSSYSAFISSITGMSYHSFHFANIGLIKSLRLVSCGNIKSVNGLSVFKLTFSDDDPMNDYSYDAPSSSIEKYGDYFLDGVDLANYGIRVLLGSIDSINKAPDVKENLRRDISVVNGIIYDDNVVTFKSKTAQIKCLMRAVDAHEFWRNRNALLYDLTRPGERTFTVAELGKDIPCFYKSCSVRCFFPDRGKFWFEFTLSLEFFKGVI